MSLILTSSQDPSNIPQFSTSAPYQYRNDFRSGLKVPPNSEIAVESVKLNRNPALDYEQSQVTLFWFGERLEVNASLDNSMSWIIPSINRIDANLSPEDFREEFEKMIKTALSLHPEIDTVNGVTMTPVHATSSVINPFQGYRYNINQVGASATSAVPPSGYEKEIFGDLQWNGTTATADGDDTYFQLQPTDDVGGPISLFGGNVTFDTFTGNNWTVGLARPIYNSGVDFVEANPTLEHTFSFADVGLGPDEDQLYDYAAQVGLDNVLRLYHLVPDPEGNGFMEMKEIIYYQKNNTATAANNGDNSSFATGTPIPSGSITDITFRVENEKVIISASGKVVVETNTISSASFKDQVPKPVNQNCWKMYPTAGLWETGDDLNVSTYECRTSSTIHRNILPNNWAFKSIIHADMDNVFLDIKEGGAVDLDPLSPTIGHYKVQRPWSGADYWPQSVDNRPLMKRFTSDSGETGGTSPYVRPYKGLDHSRLEDYEPIFIMGKSERYTDGKVQLFTPNSMNVLGFSPFAVAPLQNSVSATGPRAGGASFTSTTRPSMTSEHSTFIRVPTLNHKTFNFGTGNPSKILFQVPRFDNSGAETGALFFQNPDKTYIDLNNPAPITLTDLDVHLVRKDEKFARDLTGSTEVMFHIRQKSKL